jgi:fatty-acyl-CoA synthase
MVDQTLPRTVICAPLADHFDVQRVLAEGWPDRLPRSTYDLVAALARKFGNAPALSFFLDADSHRSPTVWSFSTTSRK